MPLSRCGLALMELRSPIVPGRHSAMMTGSGTLSIRVSFLGPFKVIHAYRSPRSSRSREQDERVSAEVYLVLNTQLMYADSGFGIVRLREKSRA
jgi:hypothetical protein